MFAQVPDWVSDGSVIVGFLVGLLTLVGILWGFRRWTIHSFKDAVSEIVDDKVPGMIAAETQPIKETLAVHGRSIDEINRSVNHIQPDEPTLIERVKRIEYAQRAYMMDRGFQGDQDE